MVTNLDQKMVTPDLTGSLEMDCPSNVHSFGAVIVQRKINIAHAVLRLLCMASSVMALSFMVTANEASTLVLYGFQIPVQSEWSYVSSFLYLVGAVAAVAAHSLLQLLISVSGVLRKSSITPSRNFGWFLFAADEVFAYTLISAGSAVSGVSNLNRTGIKHTPLPNFCKPLHRPLDHVHLPQLHIASDICSFGCDLALQLTNCSHWEISKQAIFGRAHHILHP